jgi:ribosome biogenesis GTPase
MVEHRTDGLVVRVTGKEIWVNTGAKTIPCLLRGRFRKSGKGFQIVAGDRVEISLGGEGATGVVESVQPRRSWLSRYTGGRDQAERVVVANIDVLFLVESLRMPDVSYRFVDRVLVASENGCVNVRICLNKMDLAGGDEADAFAAVYEPLGYPVLRTSAKTGQGVADIVPALEGGIYAFVGRSGVGKSSLVNRLAPGLDLEVGEVGRKTQRGRHTTTYSQLFAIDKGHVADTPGMQTFGFPGDDEHGLARCFPEFASLEASCHFQPCTHSHEPDCAVKAAVEEGLVATTRHESYLDMLREIGVRKEGRYT